MHCVIHYLEIYPVDSITQPSGSSLICMYAKASWTSSIHPRYGSHNTHSNILLISILIHLYFCNLTFVSDPQTMEPLSNMKIINLKINPPITLIFAQAITKWLVIWLLTSYPQSVFYPLEKAIFLLVILV